MNFNWPVRIYYEDTDSGGVVYYANYLKYMERARTEYLRHLGFEQDVLIKNENLIFAVRSVQADYHKPARFNDEINISTRVVELKKASILFEQQVTHRDSQLLLCEGKIRVAALTADSFKPCAIPQFIRESIRVD